MIKRDPLSGAHIRRILREIADKQLGTEYGTPVALMFFRGELALGLIGCDEPDAVGWVVGVERNVGRPAFRSAKSAT